MDENELKKQAAASKAELGDALSRAAQFNDMNDEVPDMDSITVDEKDLAMLEGDDFDIERAFDDPSHGSLGDADNDLLNEFNLVSADCGDSSDDEMSQFDMDDPNVLEKIEQYEKEKKEKKNGKKPESKQSPPPETKQSQTTKSQKPSKPEQSQPPQTARPPTQQTKTKQAQPKQAEQATSASSTNTKKTTTTSSKDKSPTVTVSGATKTRISEALRAERNREFDRIEKLLRQNLEDISSQMKLLLLEKKPEATAKAQQFLKIKQARQRDIEFLLQQKHDELDVPPYKTMSLSLAHENIDKSIVMDSIVVIVKAFSTSGSFKGHLDIELELGAGLQGYTKTFSGKKFIEVNQELIFPLPKACRTLQSFIRPIRVSKLKVTAHEKGLLWTKQIGSGELKLAPLLTSRITSGEVRLRNDKNNPIGEVEVDVKLARPFVGKELVTEDKQMIIIQREAPKPVVQQYEESTDEVDIPMREVKQPTQTNASTTKKAATTAATTPAAPAAPAPVAEVVPKSGDALLRYLKAPAETTWRDINSVGSPSVICSYDVLTSEKELATKMLASATGPAAVRLKERLESLGERIMLFEINVQNGIMPMEMYLDILRDGIKREKNTLISLVLLAKHATAEKDTESAAEYKENAQWLSKTIKVMELELKNAEEQGEDDEE